MQFYMGLQRAFSVVVNLSALQFPQDTVQCQPLPAAFQHLTEEWQFSLLDPHQYSVNYGVCCRILMRSTFQTFLEVFEHFKRRYGLENREDNFLVALYTLRRHHSQPKGNAKDLNADENISRTCVVNFNQFDWLLLSFMKSVGGSWDVQKLPEFLKKIRIECPSNINDLVNQEFPPKPEFGSAVLEYLVSLQNL